MAQTPIRVVIAEDSYLVREALEQILARADGVEVVRSCGDRDSLLAAVAEERPDCVLTDIRMPPGNLDEGIRVANELRKTHPDVGVVVLSQFAQPAYVIALFEAGIAGRAYLLKERVHEPAQLVSAIRAVAVGESVVDPRVVEAIVQARPPADPSALAQLTSREREVLAQVAQGKSNAAIAHSLVLTKRAVEKHINSIFMKLEVAGADDVSARVKATLVYLAENEAGTPGSERPSPGG
ncbi:MAG TPA: response regulator transcription factor [Candidatus Dormibacteraeota bacterium]|nr:response regulator transcription factor [Candidatus Dormibacteraeota bacterium]